MLTRPTLQRSPLGLKGIGVGMGWRRQTRRELRGDGSRCPVIRSIEGSTTVRCKQRNRGGGGNLLRLIKGITHGGDIMLRIRDKWTWVGLRWNLCLSGRAKDVGHHLRRCDANYGDARLRIWQAIGDGISAGGLSVVYRLAGG